MTRETVLARTMVELADNLVDDFDVVELLTTLADRCVEVLDVDAAGIMLIGPDGDLHLMASSSDSMRLVELFELQSREGPCQDCCRTGRPVVNRDLTSADLRWPRFAAVAVSEGFRAADALPMRLRNNIIGALNLFRSTTGSLNDADVTAAQALADIATIAIVQHRTAVDTQALNHQLTAALTSRIVIEQAKGMIGERRQLPMDQAFALLRHHTRRNNLRLADVARSIIDGTIDPNTLDPAAN
jgi:GAF domain-containing protein